MGIVSATSRPLSDVVVTKVDSRRVPKPLGDGDVRRCPGTLSVEPAVGTLRRMFEHRFEWRR
jgi:hypothetical protein